ncbi:28247_t:CDS:2, partial [Gigaspora margarita]
CQPYSERSILKALKHAQETILEDTLQIGTNFVDKPTISFFKDKATTPPDTQLIFMDMKIQQAPFPIPPIYPGTCLLAVDERSSELVVEAKILSNQRIVPVT